MIGLQEMLLQAVGEKIHLFPAWPIEWNVHFKLHAPGNTTVEAELKDGELVGLTVIPEERRKILNYRNLHPIRSIIRRFISLTVRVRLDDLYKINN